MAVSVGEVEATLKLRDEMSAQMRDVQTQLAAVGNAFDILSSVSSRSIGDVTLDLQRAKDKVTELMDLARQNADKPGFVAGIAAELDKAIPQVEQFKTELAGMQASVKSASGETDNWTKSMDAATDVLKVFGVALSAEKMVEFGKAAIENGEALEHMAIRTGMSIDNLQVLKVAADENGNSLEQIANAMNRFQNNMEANSKPFQDALVRMGLSLDEIKEKNPDEQFELIAKSIAAIPDPAERARVAIELFGRGGVDLLPTLTANIDEVRDATVIMSDDVVHHLHDLEAEMKLWKDNSLGYMGEFVAGLASLGHMVRHPLAATAEAGEAKDIAISQIVNAQANANASNIELPSQGTVQGTTLSDADQKALEKEYEANQKRQEHLQSTLKNMSTYWDDYYAAVDAGTENSFDKQRDAAKKWLDTQTQDLDKKSAYDNDYVEKLGVVWGTYYAKLDSIDTEQAVKSIENSEKIGLAAENVIDKGMGGQNVLKLMAETMGDVVLPSKLINDELIKMPDELKLSVAHMKELSDQLYTASNAAHNLVGDISTGLGPAILGAIQGGGNVGKTIGSFLGESAGKEFKGFFTEQLSNLLGGGDSESGIGGFIAKSLGNMLPGIGALVGPLIGKIADFFKNIGGPSKDELAGRQVEGDFQKQFTDVTDMINQVGAAYIANGKTAEDAQAAIQNLWAAEKQGADATKQALVEINAELQHHKEVTDAIHSEGFLSHDELMHQADIANQAYEQMLKSGQYTAAQIEAAYLIYQKALAAAGDDAAAAWVKAHDAMTGATSSASQVPPQMAAVQTELKALLDKRDSLAQGVAQEAPEQVMGVIEQQQRGQLAALDDQIQEKADQYAQLAKDTGTAMADEIVKALKAIHIDPLHIGVILDPGGSGTGIVPGDNPGFPSGGAGRDGTVVGQGPTGPSYNDFVRDYWAPDRDAVLASMKPKAQASGGDYWVDKPTLFLAGEAGSERATFTPAGKAGLKQGGGGQTMVVNLMLPDKKILAQATFDAIEGGGTIHQKFSRLINQMVDQ